MTKAISRIHVQGFRSLRDVTLEPGRVTVLIGPNGSGKSNLLSFLQMVPQLPAKALRRFVGTRGGASALLHYGPKITPVLSFRLDFTEEESGSAYEAELEYAAGDALVFKEERVCSRSAGVAAETSQTLGVGHPESRLVELVRGSEDPTFAAVSSWLAGMSSYHFHDTSMSSALRQHARSVDDRVLRSDGRNLAAFLRRLKTSSSAADQAAWRRINLMAQKIAPAIRELSPTPVEVGDAPPQSVRLDWVDDQGENFGVHDLSDGTLRAIALVTALAQPVSTLPAFITIDEPELGLHPAAMALLAGLIRSVSSRCQILLATQSPTLLDHFPPEDVVVVERKDGASAFRRLDPDALEAWLADYSLSELYDKNVLGGRP